MDVMGGGNALGEPLGLGVDRPGPEELRVVAQAGDQLRIALPQAALGQLAQRCDVRLQGWVALIHQLGAARQGPEAPHAIRHLGGVQEAVHQIGHGAQVAAAAADGRQQLEVVQRPHQFCEATHATCVAATSVALVAAPGRAPARFEWPPVRMAPA